MMMEETEHEKCKRSKKGQSSSATNTMDRLPHEVIIQILSRLPLISLMQSKLVCHTWRNLIHDPLLISNHFSHMAKLTDMDPIFIVQSNWPMPPQLRFVNFSSDSEGKVISNKLPNFDMHMYLIDSCNGLLCMRNTSRSIFICNPFTRRYIELPNLVKNSTQVGNLGFGFDPISKQYKVIQIVYVRRRHGSNVRTLGSIQSEVQILTIGTSTWRSLGMIPYRLSWPTSKVMLNKRLHWLSRPNKYTMASLIVSFDLATEQFQEVSKPDCCGQDRCLHQLMMLRGCLSAVAYHGNEHLEIWVMKQYGIKESWVKEFNIATYLPRSFNEQDIRSFNYLKRLFPNSFVRVHCMFRSGELLLEYRNRALVVYNSDDGTFKEVAVPDMSHWFRIVLHVGSLNWLDTPVNF